jgi:hypothetical protein
MHENPKTFRETFSPSGCYESSHAELSYNYSYVVVIMCMVMLGFVGLIETPMQMSCTVYLYHEFMIHMHHLTK